MSVARAKREISLEEFQDWMAFFTIENERNAPDGDE
jgi:hypothetical protein